MTPDECYFCSAPAVEYLCADCERTHTREDVAAKRLIASIVRQPSKGPNNE